MAFAASSLKKKMGWLMGIEPTFSVPQTVVLPLDDSHTLGVSSLPAKRDSILVSFDAATRHDASSMCLDVTRNLVSHEGFEPPTPAPQTRCSGQTELVRETEYSRQTVLDPALTREHGR